MPDAGSTFTGWNGACQTTQPACTVTLTGNRDVFATFAQTAGAVATYYHTDAIGSVRALSDQTGATVIRHDYLPFGEDTQPLTGDPMRFAGKELDPESALMNFEARYYRNTWGRFTQVDPVDVEAALRDPQQWNRYAYARNNPLRHIDPDGLIARSRLEDDPPPPRTPQPIDIDVCKGAPGRRITPCSDTGDSSGLKAGAAAGFTIVLDTSLAPYAVAAVVAYAAYKAVAGIIHWAFGHKIVNPDDGFTAGEVRQEWDNLDKGNSGRVHEVDSEEELEKLAERWTKGGKIVDKPGYKGVWKELPDGTGIGLRDDAESTPGNKTIDIKLPGIPGNFKVHVHTP